MSNQSQRNGLDRSRRRRRRLAIQALEARRVLDGVTTATLDDGLLYVRGTEGPDGIVVRQTLDGRFTLDYADYSFPAAEVERIFVDALGGNDFVQLELLPAGTSLPAVVDGGDGDDLLIGSETVDLLMGGAGNDIIDGKGGNDTLAGDAGDDTLKGSAGHDQLFGGLGNDFLRGGVGNDTLVGQEGNDVLHGRLGADVLDGGADNDLLFGGDPRLDADFSLDGGNQILGGDGDDTIYGGFGNDLVDAGAGDDEIDGRAGNDTLGGGDGADTLLGGAGDDQIDCGAGRDSARGGSGNDTIQGGSGGDLIEGVAGDDVLFGGASADSIYGGDGDDRMQGDAGDDLVDGGPGEDRSYRFDLNLSESNEIISANTVLNTLDDSYLETLAVLFLLSSTNGSSTSAVAPATIYPVLNQFNSTQPLAGDSLSDAFALWNAGLITSAEFASRSNFNPVGLQSLAGPFANLANPEAGLEASRAYGRAGGMAAGLFHYDGIPVT